MRLKNVPRYIVEYLNDLKVKNTYNEALADTLKKQFQNLEPITNNSNTDTEKTWNSFRTNLRKNILQGNLKEFLRFEVIIYTMFHNAKKIEYDYLKKHNNKKKWLPLIKEIPTGFPEPYEHDIFSSGNLIHSVYNLAKFEDETKIDLNKFDRIIEFGGGYGCLCRAIRKYGFDGQYIICDLPEFSYLQEYYLKSTNELDRIIREDSNNIASNSTILLNDFNKLDKIESNEKENTLFIATWSFSETPFALRSKILNKLQSFNINGYLIAYQDDFHDADNIEYFKDFKTSNNHIQWLESKIEHLPSNQYLFGIKIEI